MKLSQIIQVDEENCVNCHRCISACPVKYCNDASKDFVEVNEDMCIGCGECIKACDHDARVYLDDFDAAMSQLKAGQPMIAVVAPAVAANFPDNYLHLNGYLKSIGIKAVFDVSFGAELTVKSYLEHVKINNPKTVIAQPCPAIVTYIELYQPELIKHLAPADSPMLHMIRMVKEFYPQYRDHSVFMVSPCIAKKREFDELKIDCYNVTMSSIEEHLNKNNIRLNTFPIIDFDNDPAERAVLFSSPGGLMRTAMRENKDIENITRKIEGPHVIYEYLDSLKKDLLSGHHPVLIDCLNCEKGCNGGTGTNSYQKSFDELEHHIEKRKNYHKEQYEEKNLEEGSSKLPDLIDKFWRSDLYHRSYDDLSHLNTIKIPSQKELEDIYRDLEKYEKKDFKNCNNCGYFSCEKMGIAIFNGLNKKENCHFYLQNQLEKDKINLKEGINHISETVQHISQTNIKTGYEAVQKMVISIQEIINSIHQSSSNLEQVFENSQEIKKLVQLIFSISKHSNLLSINASIEASKIGLKGKGFAVIAQEIRKLSSDVETFTKNIEQIANKMVEVNKHVNRAMNHEKIEVENSKEQADMVKNILQDIVNDVEGISSALIQMQV